MQRYTIFNDSVYKEDLTKRNDCINSILYSSLLPYFVFFVIEISEEIWVEETVKLFF